MEEFDDVTNIIEKAILKSAQKLIYIYVVMFFMVCFGCSIVWLWSIDQATTKLYDIASLMTNTIITCDNNTVVISRK